MVLGVINSQTGHLSHQSRAVHYLALSINNVWLAMWREIFSPSREKTISLLLVVSIARSLLRGIILRWYCACDED